MMKQQGNTAQSVSEKTDSEKVIEIRGLTKSFGENNVLKGINLTLHKGENIVVLGRSGSGKSVLIKCTMGLIEPDGGSIFVFGKDMRQLDTAELNKIRKRVGFLFQSAALYDSMSVRENLEFPLRYSPIESGEELDNIVMEALNNVGLSDVIDKMPSELSGGMRKRLGLARALILKPEIILYDEPTTGLDTITSREISNLILHIQQKFKTASIIITHDMDCAKLTANNMFVMNNGTLEAQGTYEELEHSDEESIRAFFHK